MDICQNCASQTDELFAMDSVCFQSNYLNLHKGNLQVCEKCKTSFEQRAIKLKEIIESTSTKRLIVAGPGTGKTHTFKKVIESMEGERNILIFTLIKNLAEDLSKEFSGSEYEKVTVGTFHGYCKNLLYNNLGYSDEYYPDLPTLIAEDAGFLDQKYSKKNYHDALTNLDNNNQALIFFIKRASYYKAISHDYAVYTVYNHYLRNEEDVPTYDLVIADEYQDFNLLEASFIELLSKANSVLIAGDDDQALYGFRNSSTKFIRDLYLNPDYQKFSLPFTSRCTSVIEKAINNLVKFFSQNNFLKGRIEKEYKSYWPDKYMFDQKYPHIQVVRCSMPSTAELYIKNEIERIVLDEHITGFEKDIQFLVIGAESQHRLDSLAIYLRSTLDAAKYNIITKEEDKVDLAFAYKLIHKNNKNNLGWRIIIHNDAPLKTKEIIYKTYNDESLIYDNLPKEYIDKYLKIIKDYFETATDSSPIENESEIQNQKIAVKLTNCLGSKGLSSLHVFVTEFHNGVIPSDKNGKYYENEDIYKCVVSLTRAKRSCTLITFKEFDRSIGKNIGKDSSLLRILTQSCLNNKSCRIANKKLICT